MKEMLRNSILSILSASMTADQLKAVSDAFDVASAGYNVEHIGTDIIIRDERTIRAVRDYIAVRKTEGLAEGTLKNYFLLLKLFCETIGKPLDEISITDVRLWFYNYQQARKISDRTLNRLQGETKTFFSWLYDEGYIQKDILRSMKRTKYAPKQKEALCQMDLERLLDSAKEDVRAYAMLMLLYATGCRAAELVGIKLTDINMDNGSIRVTGKGNKTRDVYFEGRASIALNEWLKIRPDKGVYLFPGRWAEKRMATVTVLDTVKLYAKKSNCPDHTTTHTMRHTTATIALNRGCPVQDVQKMLGHSNIATTMIYAQVSDAGVKASHERCVV